MLNVIDLEATCWRGRPPQGQHNEIIEIGLCVVDVLSRKRIHKRQIMVRPRHSQVSEFCTELTGHTQADVDKGISYPEACRILIDEYRADSRPWASWGDYDRNQFIRQSRIAGNEYPLSSRHTNAKQIFGRSLGIKGPGMARALAMAGLPLEGRHHNGADDAWNIAALILDLVARSAWHPTTPLEAS